MLAKLLALLLQSKAAAISAVLVVGTTGALVSASTENGVTTITVTQATQSSSVSPNNETNEVATDKDTEKDSDNDDKTSTTASCDTTALRDGVTRVNTTFSQDHTALMHTRRDERGSAATQIVESTDKLLKQIRQAAVQAIHSTNTCATQEDQDSENEADNDKDEHETTRSNTTNTNTVTFTETDAKAIADDATTRMTAAFNEAKTKLAALPASAPKKETNSHRTSTEHPEGHD